MTATPWGAPPPASAGFETGMYAGAIVLVTPVQYEASVPTTYGDKDAVTCNITVCYNPNDPSKNGEEFAFARIFNVFMVRALRTAIGSTAGGRITRGQGQGGNTKYTLDEVTDENSVGYLNHYWPTHCASFKVDPTTGASLNPTGQAALASETHVENGQPANTAPPTPPAPAAAPSQPTSLPTPPPPPMPSQPATPPF